MPEYICECCNFKTNIKCKLEAHLETKKHLSTANIMEQDKDEIIKKLREENLYLKVQLFEMMFKEKEKPVQPTETNCDDYIDECVKSLELELNESLLESVAELRTIDDMNEMFIILDNVFDVFVNNEKNNLPYIKQFTDEHSIADIIIDKVLKHCSIEITEQYKGRFKLYSNNKWLEVKESRDKITTLMYSINSHLKLYPKIMKYYFSYDSKLKQLDESRATLIQPLVRKLTRQISEQCDEDELIRYILKTLNP